MTYSERLEMAMESLYEEYNPTDLDKLLQYAYFAGKEKGVREACDMATERYKEQLQRATCKGVSVSQDGQSHSRER